jgi:DNA-binding CsgD family transcriptional regulator
VTPDGLTPAERRVAALAASGRTNREIAAVLAVSAKSVEWHLGNVYRKLGIRSRKDLA